MIGTDPKTSITANKTTKALTNWRMLNSENMFKAPRKKIKDAFS